ncbi:MAG: radical SAM protein [Caldilineaceae bacterium]|nr:radical SAM protein [Caldilineaceae bacterium]
MMNFKVAPDPYQKLSLLDNHMALELAGTEPQTEGPAGTTVTRDSASQRTNKPLPCISEVTTPAGKKPLLKAMITTACERNCYYCPFRAGRNKMQRITFSPDEMAKTYDVMQRSQLVDGLFLSSGIIKGSVTTQDKIIDTAAILRQKYSYRGYIHLKIMPGAEYEQIRRAMQLADRVSVNLEGATEERLQRLAPKKDYWNELIQRLQWIGALQKREHLRASAVTQFVVGAVGDTDVELLQVSERLYRQFGLRRAYYSGFHPISQTPFETLTTTQAMRQHRLYQASFLLRDYDWQFEDLSFGQDANLRLDVDPKQAWADEHLRDAPVEINRASRIELLHIPGIGPKGADAIIRGRRHGHIRELSQLRHMGVRDIKRAAPYLLLNGRAPAQQLHLFPQRLMQAQR